MKLLLIATKERAGADFSHCPEKQGSYLCVVAFLSVSRLPFGLQNSLLVGKVARLGSPIAEPRKAHFSVSVVCGSPGRLCRPCFVTCVVVFRLNVYKIQVQRIVTGMRSGKEGKKSENEVRTRAATSASKSCVFSRCEVVKYPFTPSMQS